MKFVRMTILNINYLFNDKNILYYYYIIFLKPKDINKYALSLH